MVIQGFVLYPQPGMRLIVLRRNNAASMKDMKVTKIYFLQMSGASVACLIEHCVPQLLDCRVDIEN